MTIIKSNQLLAQINKEYKIKESRQKLHTLLTYGIGIAIGLSISIILGLMISYYLGKIIASYLKVIVGC